MRGPGAFRRKWRAVTGLAPHACLCENRAMQNDRHHPATIVRAGNAWDRAAGGLLLASATALALGLFLPVVRIDRFFFLTDRVSILQGIGALLHEGEIVVGVVVLLFSAVFPLLKLVLAFWLWGWTDVRAARFEHLARRLEWLGKWSMVDVLVVALLVFSVKATGLANATTQAGLYFFCAAVLGTALAIGRIKSAARRLRTANRA
jgi:paraquat-inducible protein A